MIVATYRDTEESPFSASVASLYRELEVDRIALDGLGLEAVAALLGGRRSDEDVRALREQTGGNPFFIEQLLPGDPMGVTDTVQRRIAALGPEAHAVLDAAAVSGAEFELDVLAEVVGLPIDAALDVLDAAVRARLISEIPDDPGRYAFVHAIVRDTLASSLTAARRTTPSRTVRRGARATCGARARSLPRRAGQSRARSGGGRRRSRLSCQPCRAGRRPCGRGARTRGRRRAAEAGAVGPRTPRQLTAATSRAPVPARRDTSACGTRR